jgi:hypothetical protein
MSRVRFGYAIACFGILITTGGCAESATAPSAANIEASANHGKKPTPSDSASVETGGDGVYTTSSGFITGGGRAEQP